MIRFDLDNKENMQKAYIVYLEEIKPSFPGRYLIASVEMYSSEGNTYCIDADFDDEPTDELLIKLAEADWNRYYKGISPDEEKQATIEKLKDSYIIIDRNELYPLFTVTTHNGKEVTDKEYFLTEEAAIKKADKYIKEIERSDEGAKVSSERIEKITMGNDGKEIAEKICIIGVWCKAAAEHIYNGLEPEDTKNLIIETSSDGELEYFDFEDEPEL